MGRPPLAARCAPQWILNTTLFLYLTLGNRLIYSIGSERLIPFMTPLLILALLIWRLFRPTAPLASDGVSASLRLTATPFFALIIILPLLGVLLGLYEVTALYTVLGPVTILGLTALSRARGRQLKDLISVAYWSLVTHGIYALVQLLHREGVLRGQPWGWTRQWDIASQHILNEKYVIVGRSTGLFVNANVFGAWSVFSIIFSAYFLKGRRRIIGISLGTIGALASQSRTAIVCLALITLGLIISTFGRSSGPKRTLLTVAGVGLPILSVAVLIGSSGPVSGTYQKRLQGLFSVSEEGVGGDQNLYARYSAWQHGIALTEADPRLVGGTLGPPGVYTQQFIDNQYVAYYLQGGILLLGAFIILLISPITLTRKDVRLARRLAAMSCIVSIAAITLLVVDSTQLASLVCLYITLSLAVRSEDLSMAPDASTQITRTRKLQECTPMQTTQDKNLRAE